MTRDEYVLAVLSASNGATHTPVQVQKLFFLLDKMIPGRVGGPYFQFRPDNYGPFDSDVYRSLESLERDGQVEIAYVRDRRKKTYRTTPSGQTLGEHGLGTLPDDVQKYVRELSDWVRRQSFAQLVSAIYAQFPDMKVNSVFGHSHG